MSPELPLSPPIVLDHVAAIRGGTTILSGISLEISPGEILSVVGRNGSGKTTLLGLLSQRLQPASGRLDFGLPTDNLAGPVFYAPQAPHRALLPHSYAFDNIALTAMIRGEARRHRLQLAQEVLRTLGFDDASFLNVRAKALSGGEQQLVLAARLLLELRDPSISPWLVLLDEVFSALDVQTRMQTALAVRNQLRRSGVTAVVVSHDLDEAMILADRIVVLGGRPGTILETVHLDLSEPRDAITTVSDRSAVAARQRVVEVLTRNGKSESERVSESS